MHVLRTRCVGSRGCRFEIALTGENAVRNGTSLCGESDAIAQNPWYVRVSGARVAHGLRGFAGVSFLNRSDRGERGPK